MQRIGPTSQLLLRPLESYSPVGDPLPKDFFPKAPSEHWEFLNDIRQKFKDLGRNEDFPLHRSDLGEARAICRIGGFGRLICRGLAPSGLLNSGDFEKDFPRHLDTLVDNGELTSLIAIHYWEENHASFIYPIADELFCICRVIPGKAIEDQEPSVSYSNLYKRSNLFEDAIIKNTPTCDIWLLDSYGSPIPAGLAQFEMMLFTLANEIGLTPIGNPELISNSPHALFEITNGAFAEVKLTGDQLQVSLCSLAPNQIQTIRSFSERTRFLQNYESDGYRMSWGIPYSKPSIESNEIGGRGLDLGSQTMVRIAQVIMKLKQSKKFDALFDEDQ